MNVILGKYAGFCFGVKRAVDGVLELVKKGETVYTIGELIHNHTVLERLEACGVSCVDSPSEIPEGGHAVIRSHGVQPEFYDILNERHIKYTDLTCPFVARIHSRVFAARSKYDAVIIVGRQEHPEVVGIKGWAGEKGIVISDPDQLDGFSAENALVVAQTTITREQLDLVFEAVSHKCKCAELFMSICETTRKRQEEAFRLAKISDAVIVVGDRKSSNTAKLSKIASNYCKNVKYIESADELLLENYLNYDIISIVAGASTPDWIIREVQKHMSELEKVQGTEAAVEETEEVKAAEEETAAEPAAVEEAAEEVAITDEPAEEAPAAEPTEEEGNDFLAELEKTFKKIRRGQFINGVVVQVSEDEVCVNIGYKSDGIIKKENLAIEDGASPLDVFKPGDEIRAEVISLNDGEGNVSLSRKKVENQQKWKQFVDELDQEKIYTCKVLKAIKGGVLSKLEGYDAFIPASQLSLKYVEDLNTFTGQILEVKIIDVDKRQKRFVLSHKEVLKARAEEEERKLFESFEKGAIIKGTVKRLTDFGAFVDVGGIDGLLHITDISWVRIKHPKDVLEENQEIEVKIINVDPEKKKISLGYKQLQPKPWDMAPTKYQVGDVVEGKVVRIAPFGAFVELEPTIDGLVHISQVANRRVEKVEDVLALGQTVTAKVLEVNAEKRRISLSIRAIMQDDRAAAEDDNAKPERDGKKRERRDDDEHFNYVIPPVEEATSTLADFFPKMDD